MQDLGLNILVFIILAFCLAALARQILQAIKIPYPITLLILGLFLGYAENINFLKNTIIVSSIQVASTIEPKMILHLFLPTLIFEAAFSLEVHLFKRMMSQISILAILGLSLTSAITSIVLRFLLHFDWPICFMFGALISATDPVSVVAVLKGLSSRRRLETLIAGEALINYGTVIVLFTLFHNLAIQHDFNFTSINYFGTLKKFLTTIPLGIIIGTTLGTFIVYWLSFVKNDTLLEITITIASSYLAFFIAEYFFHTSGVVAILTIALIMASVGKTRTSIQVNEFLQNFWQMIAFVANTIIFILVGVIIYFKIHTISLRILYKLIWIYCSITLIRTMVIFLLTPILNKFGIGFNIKKAIVLSWSGIRGVVSIALALVVSQDALIPSNISEEILILSAGIVALTILINGSTMSVLFKILGLDLLPPAKQATLNKAKMKIKNALCEFIDTTKANDFLRATDWTKLDNIIYAGLDIDLDYSKNINTEDLNIAFKRNLLDIERKSYWNQYQDGLIGKYAAIKLIEAVENALDDNPVIYPRQDLYKYWEKPIELHLSTKINILGTWLKKLAIERLSLAYDIARGFIHAQNQMAEHTTHIAPNKEIHLAVLNEITKNKQNTYDKIEQLRITFPEIMRDLETQVASNIILNKKYKIIQDLIDEGLLENQIGSQLLQKIEAAFSAIETKKVKFTPINIKELLSFSPIFRLLNNTSLEILSRAFEARIYGIHSNIIKSGEKGAAIFLIARGLVEVQPGTYSLNTKKKILGTGSVIGIFSLLNGFHSSTVIAYTPTEILCLSREKLKVLVKHHPELTQDLRKFLPQSAFI